MTMGAPDEGTIARARLNQARVARLATADADGIPHIVPVVFALAYPNTIVSAVDHKPKRTHDLKRLRNIAVRPEVSLLVDHYDDDWSNLWWVRVDGTAGIVTDDTDRKRHIGPLMTKYAQYTHHPPRGPVIAIDITTIRTWSATDPSV